MTYTQRQRLFASAWESITGDDDFARDQRTDLRLNAAENPDLAEVYRDLTGLTPTSIAAESNAWMIGRKGIRARLHGGAIRGHAGPANHIFRSVLALNDTVVTLVNRQLERPYVAVTDVIKERLGLWTLAPQPGSVVLELVAPPAEFGERHRRQAGEHDVPFPAMSQMPTPAEHSIDEIFDVLDATLRFREEPVGLEDRLVELGTDAARSLDRFAQRCTELKMTVDLDDRTEAGRSVVFKPDDANFLHRTIKTLRLDEDLKIREGTWRTASLERRIFDLVIEVEGAPPERISGIVPKSLMAASADAFNKYVQIEYKEYTRGSDDANVRRVLEKISVLRSS